MPAIAPWVSYCTVEDVDIALDVRRDRYFAFPSGSLQAASLAVRDGRGSESSCVRRIEKLGWIPAMMDGVGGDGRCSTEIPTSSLEDLALPDGQAARADVRQVLRENLIARLSLKTWGLEGSLARIDRRRASLRSPDRSLAQCCSAYRLTRSRLPFAAACLPDSLAMERFLSSAGHRATLVFGVTWRPFLAHCWLQTDRELLSDTPDRIAHFTPIRSV
jgi:hypothetical protein